MELAFKGFPETNEAAAIVSEFVKLKKLKELGYHHQLETLDVFKEACFEIIESEIDRRKEEAKSGD